MSEDVSQFKSQQIEVDRINSAAALLGNDEPTIPSFNDGKDPVLPLITPDTREFSSEENETKQETKQEPKVNEESKSEYYARLAEQDRQIRHLKKELGSKPQEDLSSLAKEDPLAALEKLGISMDDLLERWATPNDSEENTHVENEDIVKLREELSTFKKEQGELQQKSRYNAQINELDSVIGKEEDTSRWEMVSAMKQSGSLNLVVDTAVNVWKQTNEIPNYSDILDEVEKYYVNTCKEQWGKLSKIGKLKNALFDAPDEKLVIIEPESKMTLSPTQTLSGSTHHTPTPKTDQPTARDRYMSALSALDEVQANKE